MFIQIISACIIFIAFLAGFKYFIHPSVRSTEVLIDTVEKGDVLASLNANGVIIPAFEEIITSPIQSQINQIYFHVGDHVMKGDSLMALNTESTKLNLEKLKEELLLQKNKIEQLKLLLQKKMIDLETDFEVKKLHNQRLEEKLKEEEYILKLGGGTKENVKQAKLNLQIASIELRQIQQTIRNNKLSMQADMEEIRYQMNIQRKSIQELTNKLQQAELRAKNSGVITWINHQIGTSVNPGTKLVTIANLDRYKAEGKISNIYLDQVLPGNKTILRINENNDIEGTITNVLPSIDNNIVSFNINLKDETHSLLRPNMQVDVFVVTAIKEQALRIKNGAFYRGGREQYIFIVEGDEAIRKSVVFGNSNFDWIEIVDGLDLNDKVIILDMSDYEHINKLKIK